MRLIRNTKFIFSLPLALSLSLSACNFSKVERVTHEGAIQDNKATGTDADPLDKKDRRSSDIDPVKINAVRSTDLSSIYQRVQGIKTEADALSIIQELGNGVLAPEIIDNPALNIEANVLSGLTYYNAAHIQLFSIKPLSESAARQMDQYIEFISKGCSENLDNCSRIKWAKRDPRTHQVLTQIATKKESGIPASCNSPECAKQLQGLYQIIAMSFATSNMNKNVDLYKVFTKRLHDYVAVLEKNKNTESLKQQGVLFDTIVNNLDEKEDVEIILPIIKSRPPWNFSRSSNISFNFGSEKIFRVASKNILYVNGKLNPDLQKMMLEEQKEMIIDGKKNPKANDTIYLTAKKLKEDPSTTHVFKNLNFNVDPFLADSFYDEYFFIVERLRKDHLNFDEAEAIWQGSKKDLSVLIKKIQDIARLELVDLVVRTNKYFSVVLETKNLPSDRLFIKSVEDSRPLTETWGLYFSRLSKVSNLLGQIATNSSLSDEDRKKVDAAKNFIITIKRNVKFMSVYPNMLTLGYFMIKIDAMFTIETWWGAKISIDPKTIVNFLLDGGFENTWYIFAGDSSPLNKSEILLAFDYALRLGSFEIFGQAKDEAGNSKIDRLQFFKGLKSTMDENIKQLTDTIEKIQRVENESDTNLLLSVCQTPEFKGVQVNMKLETFEQYALFGDTNKGLIGTAAKYYESTKDYFNVPARSGSGKVYSLRDSLNNRFLQLRAMSLPLLENIKSMNIAESEKTILLQKVQSEIRDVYSKLQTYYMAALNNHHLIKNCTQALVKAERERQFYILNSEIKHFTDVYNAMLAVYNEKTPAKKSELAKSLESQVRVSAEVLESDTYRYSKFDVYSRFKAYSSSPELKIKVQVDDPVSSTGDTLKADPRIVPFIDMQSNSPVSLERFLKTAMSSYNSQGTNTIQWFRNNTVHKLSQIKQESMIAIYKLGFDLGLQKTEVKYKDRKLKPILAEDIVNETASLALSLNIAPEEEKVMRLMGQFDLVPFSDLQGFLFDTTETDFYGVVDNVFLMTTRIQEDLGEAERYYKERLNTRRANSMIFPMNPEVEKAIHEIYQSLVKKDEALVADFIRGIRVVQQKFSQNPLKFAYRLIDEGNTQMIYDQSKITGGGSVLVDERKVKALNDTIFDFHNRRTFRVYSADLKQPTVD